MTASKKIVLGLTTVVVFSLCLFVAIPIGVKVPAYVSSRLNSPAFWPTTLSAFLIFLGILQFAAGVREALVNLSAAQREPGANGEHPVPVGIRVTLGIVMLAAYYVATIWLGIVLSSMLAIAAFMLAYGVRRPLLIGILSIAIPIVLYGFFVDLAHLPLPMGIFH